MQVIANNITSRNPRIAEVLRQRVAGGNPETEACPGLKDVVQSCLKAGADVIEINLQQHLDQPETMVFAVEVIQEATDHQLCLSAHKAATLEAGLKVCRNPPIINYLSLDMRQIQEILPLAAKYKAELILLISDPAKPEDARQMLGKAAALVGAANESGISDEAIILDPGIFHITHEIGQRHMSNVIEFMRKVSEIFSPSIRTTCWVENGSAGAPESLRPFINTSLLAFFAGLGVSSVFIDVLEKNNLRMLRMLKVLFNKEIFADAILSL
jgi:cobalamin-dependent methionine synthase I